MFKSCSQIMHSTFQPTRSCIHEKLRCCGPSRKKWNIFPIKGNLNLNWNHLCCYILFRFWIAAQELFTTTKPTARSRWYNTNESYILSHFGLWKKTSKVVLKRKYILHFHYLKFCGCNLYDTASIVKKIILPIIYSCNFTLCWNLAFWNNILSGI